MSIWLTRRLSVSGNWEIPMSCSPWALSPLTQDHKLCSDDLLKQPPWNDIDRLILGMAQELRQGRIEAVPLPESCGFCQYRGVCGITKSSRLRDYCLLDKEAALQQIQLSLFDTETE